MSPFRQQSHSDTGDSCSSSCTDVTLAQRGGGSDMHKGHCEAVEETGRYCTAHEKLLAILQRGFIMERSAFFCSVVMKAVRVHTHQPHPKTTEINGNSPKIQSRCCINIHVRLKSLKKLRPNLKKSYPPDGSEPGSEHPPAAPHLDINVVFAVFYHADVGVVDGLLVVFNAG